MNEPMRSMDWESSRRIESDLTPVDASPLWRNRPFMRLWIAQALTQTAQNAIWYALLVMVEEASHSTTQIGVTILSVIVPAVLFGVPAGAYVDRWDKRKVLVMTNLARCFIMFGYIAFGSVVGLLFLVSFVFSVVSQFFAPAETSMIPVLAAKSRLMQANSFFHLTFTASQFIGLVFLGPLLVKVAGLTTFFLVMLVLFGVSALLVWFLPSHRPTGRVEGGLNPVTQLIGQLREVVELLRADRAMLEAMGYLTVGMTLGLVIAMIAPRFAVDALGIAAADAVFILAPAGVGMLAGAFVLSRATSGPLLDKRRVITIGLLTVSLALGVVASLPALGRTLGVLRPQGVGLRSVGLEEGALIGGVMLATLLAGAGFAAIVVASQTLLQEHSPAHVLGRVFAVQLTLGNLATIVPLLAVGGLSDLIGVGPVLMGLAVATMLVAGLSTTSMRGAHRP